ncbi:alpha-L-arabinofuranosidase C-terminal domain-containing protein [Marinilabilia sp.]|uniref:alpha-N-arabinofuranosidase n=1 Tax=Marinilabilia sp. TaxID=2021252 RepID=UPI0025BD0BAF|nr:alpha-L-arabinofuranosidase C-terminal domain-containing protein [Marinilabilia sp.]
MKMNFNFRKHVALLSILAFISLFNAGSVYAQKNTSVKIIINPDHKGPVINRHIFGHFAEHLGTGIYGGIWVGLDSEIPNTRGIRNDVVEALIELKVPNVRWPGGCFADQYHWRDGIGTPDERNSRINVSWGGAPEPNSFGTHEYFDFLNQIGSEAFVSANVGSGTVQESADWLEYLTATGSTLAEERDRNGHPDPYDVEFWGIGNEVWGCGGPFTPQEYITELKKFATFTTNYNTDVNTQFVAVGPDSFDEFSFGYTEAIMKAWANKTWTWNIQGLSLHNYTRGGYPPEIPATDFDEKQYAEVIQETLGMDEFIAENRAIMDKYDPNTEVSILVDEWGAWYAPTEGTNPGFLQQQNSQRDAIIAALNFNIFTRHAERVHGANIAQMINVLQAVILTEDEKMILTPTYHAFRMYVPFQDAARLDIEFDAGKYQIDDIELPRVDVIAAKGKDGQIYVAITNIDPNNTASFELPIEGFTINNIKGETLYASEIDAHNTFDNPDNVAPKKIDPKVSQNKIAVNVQPQSLTVLEINTKK